MAQRWGIDVDAQLQRAVQARALPDLSAIWAEVFARPEQPPPDVDEDLYGGFVGNADRRRLNDLRAMSPTQLGSAHPAFDDARLPELLFRYRARNFPALLTDEEAARWEVHRVARLWDGVGGARRVQQLADEIAALSASTDAQGQAILTALSEYAQSIAPRRDR